MDAKRKTYLKGYRKTYKSKVHRINLTLSKSEYRDFQRVAKADNQKVTPYIKQIAIAALQDRAHIPKNLADELQTLRFAVLNIANNVNQIAHHSNTIRNFTQSDEHNLLQYLKQLDEVIRSYTSGQLLNKDESHDN